MLGSLLEVRRDRLAFVRGVRERYGDAVAFRMGPRRLFIFSHPEAFRSVLTTSGRYIKGPGLAEARPLLGDGLLSADDQTAAAMRKVLAASFRPEALRSYAPEMVAATDRAVARWLAADSFDLVDEMFTLTLDVLGQTLLGADLGAEAASLAEDIHRIGDWAMRKMTAFVRLPLSVPTPRARAARQGLRRLEAWARRLEDATDRSGNTLPAVLLRAGVEPRRRRDELLTFLLAGHETTAAVLSWAWWLLGTHPEAEARFHAELDSVLDGPPTLDDLQRLPFTRAVIDETMRLYPPVWLVPRHCLGAEQVAGLDIPPRSDVLLCTYTMHRHPDLWPEPEEFRPERFLVSRGSRDERTIQGAYLPFGLGARSCLGGRFALLEAQLVLASVGRQIRLLPKVETVLADPGLTLRPCTAIPTRVGRREPRVQAQKHAGAAA